MNKIKKIKRKIKKIVSKSRENQLQREILRVKLNHFELELERLERLKELNQNY